MSDLLSELKQLYESQTLPSHDDLLALTDQAITVLEHEDTMYRPQGKANDGTATGGKADSDVYAGGLLDFTHAEALPLIVVPDLHARCDFFLHLLTTPLAQLGIADAMPATADETNAVAGVVNAVAGGATVLDALAQKNIRVVCVGDLFHSEKRGKSRWLAAWKKYLAGDYESDEMTAEMQENLTLFQMVLKVKNAFPAQFHFLKGNHENILNKTGGGDYSFRKFADEGNMVYDFMASHYGDAILHVMSLWEQALPLCAAFPNAVVSHAEPKSPYTRQAIIDYHAYVDVVFGLIWTANDEAHFGSVEATMKNLLGAERTKTAVWLSGHRPVRERYAVRQDGKLVQIHNPEVEQVAVVLPQRMFNAKTDIVDIDNEEV